MKSNNRKLGNNLEQRIAEIMSAKGFWVHLLTQSRAGQPADLIAVKKNRAVLIDAKVVSDGVFDSSRIEGNQLGSMKVWSACGNSEWWFAMEMPDGDIFMVGGDTAVNWVLGHPSEGIYEYQLRSERFLKLEEWCDKRFGERNVDDD